MRASMLEEVMSEWPPWLHEGMGAAERGLRRRGEKEARVLSASGGEAEETGLRLGVSETKEKTFVYI